MVTTYTVERATSAAAQQPAAAFLTLGMDVGGTKTACVVTDENDRVLLREVVPTNAALLEEQLISLAQAALARFDGPADAGSVEAVGVAVPGHVEPASGRVGLAVNLGGREVALGPLIEESLGLPCYVEHDARAAAAWLAERESGPGSEPDLAYISIGTGISAGIVLGGRVLRGTSGFAGEIGHATADPAGARCACGLQGCLETVAAGPAVAQLARAAVAQGRATSLSPGATAADVFRAAAAGDQLAGEVSAMVAQHLGRAVRQLVLTVGVSRVIVGGGVASAGQALLEPVERAIGHERETSALVAAAFAQVSLEILPPEVEAGARGAAAIARQQVNMRHREGVGNR
jgi:glucokinase